MFWRVFKKYPQIYIFKDELSYLDIQDINALLDMEEDHNSAVDAYHEETMNAERSKG